MITKERLLREMLARWDREGYADWRTSRDANCYYLLIRAVNERAALVIAPSGFVRCDDKTLASLALEMYRLARPLSARNEGILVYPSSTEVAVLYRDLPINKFGGPRFGLDFEVSHHLDDFTSEIRQVLENLRNSIWLTGSDAYGLPATDDLVNMIHDGRYSSNMVRLLSHFPGQKRVLEVLIDLTNNEDNAIVVTAMSVLKGFGEPLSIDKLLCIASDVDNRAAASAASRLLAYAVVEGSTAALEGLFQLSSNKEWLKIIEPRWARRSIASKELLRESVFMEYPKKARQ